MSNTAAEKILTLLAHSGKWLAVHEFRDHGLVSVSENSASARLRELRRLGLVECRKREGKAFKEWRSVPKPLPGELFT